MAGLTPEELAEEEEKQLQRFAILRIDIGRKPYALSGGEQQMLCIARALMQAQIAADG